MCKWLLVAVLLIALLVVPYVGAQCPSGCDFGLDGRDVAGGLDGARFSPLDLDPVLWLDANDAATRFQQSNCTIIAALDGDVVGCWQDKSGNNNHATQATTAKKPALRWVAGTGWVLRFDGTDDYLATASLIPVTGAGARTLIAVVVNTAPSVGLRHILHYGTGAADQAYGLVHRALGFGNHYWASDFSSSLVPTTDPWILVIAYDGTTDELWANGLTRGTKVIALNTGSVTPLRVGSRIAAAAQFAQTDIAEIFVFPAALSDADRQQMEQYLTRWNITLAQHLPRDRYLVQAHRLALADWLSPLDLGSVAYAQETTRWKHREVQIVPATQLGAASSAAKNWDPDERGDLTFSVPLSADGKEPATHWGCETALTDGVKDDVSAASVGAVDQIQRYDVSDGWAFNEALVDLKLKRIEAGVAQ